MVLEEKEINRIMKNPLRIRNIENPSEELCLDVVKRYGLALEFIENQTKDICLEAVRENGLAIKFVKNPDDDIYKEAILQNEESLKYIENISKELLVFAMENVYRAVDFIDIKEHYETVLEYIDYNPLILEYLSGDSKIFLIEKNFLKVSYYKDSRCKDVTAYNINDKWYFNVGCQKCMTESEFRERIFTMDGGLEANPHRYLYLDFMNSLKKEEV